LEPNKMKNANEFFVINSFVKKYISIQQIVLSNLFFLLVYLTNNSKY
jgi:hypothetical protein